MVERCSNCVLSSAFPGIEFDQDGVCNFCRDETIIATEKVVINEAIETISDWFDKVRGENQYDAIVCFSGGKDSSYTIKLAVEKYNLNVLSFTLDNGYISPKAFENINKVVDALGVDHFTYRPSKKIFNKMIIASIKNPVYSRSSLRRISSGCNTCISIVNNIALKTALEKDIPYILAGFTLGQIPANSIMYQNNYPFFAESRKRSLDILRKEAGSRIDEYLGLSLKLQKSVDNYPYVINLLCLEDITEAAIVEKIKPMGWERPGDVDGCSSNCRLNTFNNIVHMDKYGYSPYELELSHLILKKQLTRKEAIVKLEDQSVELYKQIKEELGFED